MKKILIALLAIVVLFIGYVVIDGHSYSGEYESKEQNSTYYMKINHGFIKIIDVGAGNPVLKGNIVQIPGKEKCVLFCLFDGDFDGTLLNLNSNVSLCDFIESKACRSFEKDGKQEKTLHNIVVFNPYSDDERVVFEQPRGKGEPAKEVSKSDT